MTINERVKLIRKNKKLSMDAFGAKIGIKRSAVSRLESGQNNASGRTIKAICREFNVREDWLLNGTGEMYEDDGSLDALIQEFGFSEREKKFTQLFLTLDETKRRAALHYLSDVIDALNAQRAKTKDAESSVVIQAQSIFEKLKPEYKKYVLKQIDELLEIQDKENKEDTKQ